MHPLIVRSRSRTRSYTTRTALAAALALGCAAVHAAGDEQAVSVFANGLNSPRGLAFDADGALWVAEAGVPVGEGPSIIIRGEPVIYTETGAVTRVAGGRQARIFQGLPTMYIEPTGQMESGPTTVGFAPNGTLHVLIGYPGVDPALRFSHLAPGGYQLGRLVTLGGAIDVAAHEGAHNPDGELIESIPWNMAWSGDGWYVTDAAANALLHVDAAGSIATVAVFPPRDLGGPFPTQAVPTGVAVGPDGAVYVSELTGFPFVPGSSRVMRVDAGGSASVFAGGFTMAIGIAFDAEDNLYVLEHDDNGLLQPGSQGNLWRIAPDGTRVLFFSQGLDGPTGLTIGPDGSIYITNFGNHGAGAGEVWRIAPELVYANGFEESDGLDE